MNKKDVLEKLNGKVLYCQMKGEDSAESHAIYKVAFDKIGCHDRVLLHDRDEYAISLDIINAVELLLTGSTTTDAGNRYWFPIKEKIDALNAFLDRAGEDLRQVTVGRRFILKKDDYENYCDYVITNSQYQLSGPYRQVGLFGEKQCDLYPLRLHELATLIENGMAVISGSEAILTKVE